MFDQIWEERLHWAGTTILRYGLAFLFLRFGIYKFIQPNVTGVQVWTAHSLLLFWVDPLLGPRGGEVLIGVIEIVAGALIALRPVAPRLSMFGSLMAAFAMFNTLSFLFTTPGLDARMSGFLIKDVMLLGELFGQQPKLPPPIASGASPGSAPVRQNQRLKERRISGSS